MPGNGDNFNHALCNDQVASTYDSRCYLVKDDIVLLTEDHSLVNYLVRKKKKNKFKPPQTCFNRALGMRTALRLISMFTRYHSEYLLLCTDGLTSLVTPEEIHRVVFEQPHMDSAVDYLVDLANDRGGYDNITLVIVKGVGTKR